MTRLILTFETVFKVLSADKLLRSRLACRPTPTPPGLTSSICGIALEITNHEEKDRALRLLEEAGNRPLGVHEVG